MNGGSVGCAFSTGPFPEVAVDGCSDALAGLARSLATGVTVECDSEASEAYDLPLREIRVSTQPGERVLVRANVDEGALEVTGDPDLLAILAGNIADLAAEAGAGEHLHVEYLPDHFFLDERSTPLVVELHD